MPGRSLAGLVREEGVAWKAAIGLMLLAAAVFMLGWKFLWGDDPIFEIDVDVDRAETQRLASGDLSQDDVRKMVLQFQLEAKSRLDSGNTAAALNSLVAALVLDPDNPIVFHALGVVYSHRNEFGLAERALRHAIRLGPEGAGFNSLAHLGWIYANRGEYEAAERQFALVMQKDPQHFFANYYLGMCKLLQGQYAAARDSFERSISIDPQHPGANYELGLCLEELGDFEGAREAFERTVALRPEHRHAHFHLSRMLSFLGDEDGALRASAKYDQLNSIQQALGQAQEAIQKDPEDLQGYVNLAALYAQIGRPAEAIQTLQDASILDPDNALIHLFMGRVLLESRQLQAAKQELDRALELDADSSVVWEELGKYHVLMENRREALRSYRRAYELDSNNLVAVNNLAWLLAEFGEELDLALELSEHLLEAQPQSGVSYDTLAWVQFKRGDRQNALELVEKALQLEPGNATFREHQRQIRGNGTPTM
ncbi:MAG: tetratricopeptide repeat protein [Verrucomicrobiota bacterium]|jgi:tetratricopeptide (TPR) repeat protein|nr:tetratricopeptide repeat protein [Verrucomicrobiota bacterium]MDD8044967.1 tetratricopeptide repeat protein [Verrucomicrobiota bacterium]MDI9385568.1 tetratricopeptide repeat protein [Verrucomicrobiota bacterium]